MLSANVCAGFFCSCYGEFGFLLFLGFVGAPWGAVCMGDTSSAGFFPSSSQGSGYVGVLFVGHAFLAVFSGCILYVILGESSGLLRKVLYFLGGNAGVLGMLCCIC